jgi:hypothetical protein
MTQITPEQLAKAWRREHGEDVFRAEYKCSRVEWVEGEVRKGRGRKEAEDKSRRLMTELRAKDTQNRVEAASRWRDALCWVEDGGRND